MKLKKSKENIENMFKIIDQEVEEENMIIQENIKKQQENVCIGNQKKINIVMDTNHTNKNIYHNPSNINHDDNIYGNTNISTSSNNNNNLVNNTNINTNINTITK